MKGRTDILARMLKRVIDILISGAVLLLASPLMVIIAGLVWAKHGLPVLFKQERPGLNGKPFHIYKFRSMKNSLGPDGVAFPDNVRLTGFGRFLRSTSLDELPELWNVLRGDMSLVGPRPLLMEYLPLYSAFHARRHEVRPGVTGLAQINGRNAISWKEKLDLDVHYVDTHSVGGDFAILWKTLFKVFRREGISNEGHVTMPRMTGPSEKTGQ